MKFRLVEDFDDLLLEGRKSAIEPGSELKKLKEAEELTPYGKIKQFIDNMPDTSKTIDADIHKSDADASSREFIRNREAAHKEVWNLINDLRVKYKYSLKEIEDIINYELEKRF